MRKTEFHNKRIRFFVLAGQHARVVEADLHARGGDRARLVRGGDRRHVLHRRVHQ